MLIGKDYLHNDNVFRTDTCCLWIRFCLGLKSSHAYWHSVIKIFGSPTQS